MTCTPDCLSLQERAATAHALLEESEYHDTADLFDALCAVDAALLAAHKRCREEQS
jgi:hypothetical protein